MGRLTGKVAVISGIARGQGRSHAVALAREGASIVGFDICDRLRYPLTPPSTNADLALTVELVEAEDQRCLAVKADARDLVALDALAQQTVAEFGRLDILLVNHGIWSIAPNTWELEEESWQESIDVLLTGAWKTVKAFTPSILSSGNGGAIVLTGSTNALKPQASAVAYTAAKHGLLGMMKVLAIELGPHNVRVNAVNPGGIDTPMFREGGTFEQTQSYQPEFWSGAKIALPIDVQPPQSISDAVLWLVSDEARYVTGASINVDAGAGAF